MVSMVTRDFPSVLYRGHQCTQNELREENFCSVNFCSVFRNTLLKKLRRNPTENRAILGFSGQKSRIIFKSILQSFLHFLKAKYINNYLKKHRKQFPMGKRENKFQSSGILCKHRQNSLHQNFQEFHTKFNICFRRLVL